MQENTIKTIRYMGNKSKLINFIIPEIKKITKPGDIICDVMAGTNSIGYALKDRNIIYSNDIQYYSYVIANCILINHSSFNVHKIIDKNYKKNIKNHFFCFFEKNYSNTYFSHSQCQDIDSLRYSISKLKNKNNKFLFLTALMSAMCTCQSTTGHFAQYLNENNLRAKKIKKLSIVEYFYKKVFELIKISKSKYKNICFNLDVNELLKDKKIKKVKCFYLDPPYTADQYSRFYHILETVCKYNFPKLTCKAKYPEDRTKSKFCYTKSALDEFKKIINFCKCNNSNLLISYSTNGLVKLENLISACKEKYNNVTVKYQNYNYSSQGKGNIPSTEVLIILEV